jgi:hypothetical protein
MQPLVAESSFEVLSIVLDSNLMRKEKYGECVDLLLNYLTAAASFTSSSLPSQSSQTESESMNDGESR